MSTEDQVPPPTLPGLTAAPSPVVYSRSVLLAPAMPSDAHLPPLLCDARNPKV